MDDELQPPKHFGLVAAAFEGGLAVVAVAVGWLVAVDPLESLHWDGVRSGIVLGLLGTIPPLAMFAFCLKWPIGPLRSLVRIVDETLLPMFRTCGLAELAIICILAGLGEEMLFRGLVQTAVAGWIGGQAGTWIALAIASILFGLLHRITNTYAVLAALIGLYLGWLWLITGNLLVPIVVHAVYDFLALAYLLKGRK